MAKKKSIKRVAKKQASSKNTFSSRLNSFKSTMKQIKPLYYFISGGLIVLLIILLIGNQVYVTLNSELSIDLQPVQKSFSVLQNDMPSINFSLEVDTPVSCSATCVVTLKDLSSGQVLSSETLLSVDKFSKTYELPISQIAPGQQIFSYQVACQNQQRSLCASSNETYFKTSLVTVNIEQTPAQLHKQEEVEFVLTDLLEQFGVVDTQIQQVIHQATALDYASTNSLPRTTEERTIGNELDLIKQAFAKLLLEKNTLLNQWKSQDYDSVDIDLSADIHRQLIVLENDADELLSEQVNLWQLTENLSLVFLQLNEFEENINYAHSYYTTVDNEDRLEELNLVLSLLDDVNKEFIQKNFTSFFKLQEAIVDLQNQLTNILTTQHAREQSLVSNLLTKINQSEQTSQISSLVDYCSFINTSSSTNSSNTTSSKYCPFKYSKISINYSIVPPIIFNSGSFSPTLQTTLPVNELQCCFDGDCSACCVDGACANENYPVIFLHGHSFNKANSPEDSLVAFSKFQQRLQEDGYINGGQLSADSLLYDLPEGEWGKVNNPITVRATYYYVTLYDLGEYEFVTQKTDKIENYALRLREVIDLMKYKTGKDKVIIVAHSMGGLVAREYISLFGEENVDTLIMVGTPNFGVSGITDKFCAVTGASKECADMSQDSVFLRRLNAPQNVPKEVDVYTIYGTGCKMDGGAIGDGIVKATNVPLEYATNFEIEGECTDSLQTDLHSHLMDPDRYPEVYDIISFILSED